MRPGDPKEVKQLFNDLSERYDLLNDVFSFGFHRLWKRELLTLLKPSKGENWLDLCCGTGDLTISLAKIIRPNGKVLGIDSAENQILLARKKLAKESWLPIEFMNRDIFDKRLDCEDLDGVVMAYGLRNLINPLSGLKTIRRFLKQGGRAGVLDFNRASNGSFTSSFQSLYLSNFVIPIASQLKLGEHYFYLKDSLRNFPDGPSQEKLAKEAGFLEAKHQKIAGGQMGILILKN